MDELRHFATYWKKLPTRQQRADYVLRISVYVRRADLRAWTVWAGHDCPSKWRKPQVAEAFRAAWPDIANRAIGGQP